VSEFNIEKGQGDDSLWYIPVPQMGDGYLWSCGSDDEAQITAKVFAAIFASGQRSANAELVKAVADAVDQLDQLEAGLIFKGPPSHIAHLSKQSGSRVAKSIAASIRLALKNATPPTTV